MVVLFAEVRPGIKSFPGANRHKLINYPDIMKIFILPGYSVYLGRKYALLPAV
jgi:hypothetical protein